MMLMSCGSVTGSEEVYVPTYRYIYYVSYYISLLSPNTNPKKLFTTPPRCAEKSNKVIFSLPKTFITNTCVRFKLIFYRDKRKQVIKWKRKLLGLGEKNVDGFGKYMDVVGGSKIDSKTNKRWEKQRCQDTLCLRCRVSGTSREINMKHGVMEL